jgi:hypothetical protein
VFFSYDEEMMASPKPRGKSTTTVRKSRKGDRKPYFIKLPSWLMLRSDLSFGAKMLYAWLCNGVNLNKGKSVSPTQALIAQRLGTNRYQIGDSPRSLKKWDYSSASAEEPVTRRFIAGGFKGSAQLLGEPMRL